MISRLWRLAFVCFPALILAVPPLAALESSSDSRPFIAESLAEALPLRCIGPAVMGGRVAALAVDSSDPRVFYVGAASGGLWRTTNFGTTFEPVFDDQPVASIGAVALAPSAPSVVWVGTGEPDNRQSSSWGNGVYRSNDGGKTWLHLGLEDTKHIGRIAVHPSDPDTAYVAALGHLWGANPQRGVFKTADGGRSWEKVLFLDQDTGAVDIVMHPGDPQTLFAALYQRRRTPFGFNGGGSGSGIYRTRDGGRSWQELTQGLPRGPKGRIGLAVSKSSPSIVYASVEASDGGLYRSDDGGDNWRRVSDLNPRPMYFSTIRVDPSDSNRIWMLGVRLHLSTDGGRTFSRDSAQGVHPDHHDLWIDPSDPKRMVLAGDGGLAVSFDGGLHWRMLDNLPIGQFYKISADWQDPYNIYGGLQDNGTWMGPSAVLDTRGIRNADWRNVHGGDGFYSKVDPLDPTVIYAQSQRGRLVKVDARTGRRQRIQPRPPKRDPSLGNYRWNWSSPIVLSSHDPSTLYTGANLLLRSRDKGESWTVVSPDLTHAIDRRALTIMGAPPEQMLARHDGVAFYGTLTALAESPLDAQVLYAGSDDGRVHATRNGGADWTDLSPFFPGLPQRAYVSSLAASHHLNGRVYVAFDNHRNDDYHAHAYVSDDFGLTWARITEGLPESSVNVIVEHPRNPDLLFLGSETGLHFSLDAGRRWQRLQSTLPAAPVDDLLIHPRENDLIVGTHGRSAWILDDITPLETWNAQAPESKAHLFPLRTARSYSVNRPQAWTGHAEYAALNPPFGAIIRYRLMSDSPEAVLSIRDMRGNLVRRLRPQTQAGFHKTVWDLRLEPPSEFEAGDPRARLPRRLRGREAKPGRYQVQLQIGQDTWQQDFEVKGDPRIPPSPFETERRQ